MHACIAAFSRNVPVVPMAYSRKFEGLFGSLGYNATVDCQRSNEGHIISRVLEQFSSRSDLATQVAMARNLGLARLEDYTSALMEVIYDIALSKSNGTLAIENQESRDYVLNERL